MADYPVVETKRYHDSKVEITVNGDRYGSEITTPGRTVYVVPPAFDSANSAYRYAQKRIQRMAR